VGHVVGTCETGLAFASGSVTVYNVSRIAYPRDKVVHFMSASRVGDFQQDSTLGRMMRGPATVRIYVLVTTVTMRMMILFLYLIHFRGGNPDMWVVDSHRLYVTMIYQNWIFGFALAVIVKNAAMKSLQVSAKVVMIHGD
jgi:hypothetical protein